MAQHIPKKEPCPAGQGPAAPALTEEQERGHAAREGAVDHSPQGGVYCGVPLGIDVELPRGLALISHRGSYASGAKGVD